MRVPGAWLRLAATLGVVAAAAAGGTSAAAQSTGAVAGGVVDEGGERPVADAAVFVDGGGRSALTDARGHFLLVGLPVGEVTLVVERLGYATLRRPVEVTAGGTVSVTLRLRGHALSVPAMVVTATREARRLDEVAASVGVVSRTELAEAHPTHPSEIMGKVPGVWVNVTGGEGHMTAIRQPLTTDPVYLYLEDGVPTRSTGFFNHNALYEIDLPQAERVEVMKGPANALYGSDAIGGVVNVQTRAPSQDAAYELSVEGGAYGFVRVLGSASGRLGGEGLRLDANHTRTDGWRDGTGYRRWSGNLRWDRTLPGGMSMKSVLAASFIDQSTAGSSALSRADFEANPTRNLTPISWRQVGAVRLSSEVEKRLGSGSLSVTPYVRSNSMDILPNWSLSYDPAVWESSNLSFGFLAKARRDLPSVDGQVIVGVDADLSPGEHVERAVAAVQKGGVYTSYTEGETLYDYDVTYQQVSPYIHAEVAPATRLRLSAGLRLDLMRYEYENHLSVVETGVHRRPADASPGYASLSPKLGATFALADAASVFAAYRRGFRAPSEGQLFRQGSAENTVGLQPVKADAFEAGLRGTAGRRLRWELAAYHMTKRDDILGYQLPDGRRENVNAGETLHRGIEAGLGLLLAPGLTLDAAWTWTRHTYQAWSPTEGVDYSGELMEAAPSSIGNVDLAWHPTPLPGLRLSATWSHLGPYWTDAHHSEEYEGHDLLGVGASFTQVRGWGVFRGFGVFARVHNLTDERYAERASYNAFRGVELAPGLPRTLYVGMELR